MSANENIVTDGEWVNTAGNTHTAMLQRLDSLIKGNGGNNIYSSDSFIPSLSRWVGVPVIYDNLQGDIKHPDFDLVLNDGLNPDKYKRIGTITKVWIPDTGEPSLMGNIEIDDQEISDKITKGEISLSTGFSATNTGTDIRTTQEINPNHVLIFERGVCPGCYPNDNSAMFTNIAEGEKIMAENEPSTEDHTKTIVNVLKDGFASLKPTPAPEVVTVPEVPVKEEAVMNVIDTEEYKNIVIERDELKTKLDELELKIAQDDKDTRWNKIKTNIPEGWLGDKETETRTLFETNAPEFVEKLVEHNNTVVPETKAEGTTEETNIADSDSWGSIK